MEKIIKQVRKDSSLPSREQLEEWVKEIAESSSTLPHYLDGKTFMVLRDEIENILKFNKIEPREFMEKLDGYRYVDEIHELFRGKYIRWIRKKTHKITNGGMLMDIKFLEEGVQILCRNSANRFIQFKLDDCLVFQKLTDEEWMLLSVKSQI